MTPEEIFSDIAQRMALQHPGVGLGKMMSSPGIQYKNKNFAFFWNDHMVFKLGEGFDPETMGVDEWEYLAPFKTKPPMKAWYRVPPAFAAAWPELAELAYRAMQKQVGK